MDRTVLLIAITAFSVGISPVFAESYQLKVDEHIYDLEYTVDAEVLAMEIDREDKSLLIDIEDAQGSNLSIILPDELLAYVVDDNFIVLVDWQEADYQTNPVGDNTEITFFVPALSQEIEIKLTPIFSESYQLKVDEHSYDLEYTANAGVLAMEIDQESKSLLIGIQDAEDDNFSIILPNEMISAEDDDFVVLVDWQEASYRTNPVGDNTEIIFFVPDLSQEIEIIGTHVIPEFPFAVLVLFLIVSCVIVLTKNSSMRIR